MKEVFRQYGGVLIAAKRHKCISRVDGKYCAGSGRHACAAHKYMG